MPTNKEIETEHRNKKLIADYKHALSKAPVNKTKFAEEHGTSLRTLNRVLDSVGLKQAKFEGEAPASKSKTIKKAAKKAKIKVVDVPATPASPEEFEGFPTVNSDELPDDEQLENELNQEFVEPTPDEVTVTSSVANEELPETASETKAVITEIDGEVSADTVNNEIISWTVDKTRFISVMLSSGETLSVEKDHQHYDEIIHNLAIGDYKDALSKMSIKHKIANLTFGNFVVNANGILFNGKPVQNDIVPDLVDMFARKEPIEHLLKFYENLMMTPSEHIYTHLWKLIKHAGVTITPEGNVECFKKVKSDWTDCYTGKIYNRIGDTVTMRRTDVVDDPNKTCEAGLHVCALQYLNSSGYGGSNGTRIVKVVVRPQDFVSIPSDYQFTKARTCRYKVVSQYTGK